MQALYTRFQEQMLHSALSKRRVVILSGARQTGKTTLARNITKKLDAIYRTLDNLTLLDAAQKDPQGFVSHGNELMVIDEIQKAPELLQTIKQSVDDNTTNGRFLLTGSANINSLPGTKESLAGRVSKIRLRPLVQSEIISGNNNFINNAFNEVFTSSSNPLLVSHTKDYYLDLALRGGYPEALTFEDMSDVHFWHKDYINAIIERDLKDIANIHRISHFKNLLQVISSWSSKLIDYSSIGSHLSLSRPTLITYINILETLFFVDRLPAWCKTDFDRAFKREKLFMSDSGLMSSILDWNLDKVRLDGERNGKLIETFVFNQLATIVECSQDYKLYHYRDRDKREIDFLIENKQGDFLGIEVKAGSSISSDSFKHMRWFKTHLAVNHNFIGIVLYTGQHIVSFGDNMWAVPICAIWY